MIGLKAEIIANTTFVTTEGTLALATDTNEFLISNGDGTYVMYPNVIGWYGNIGTYAEIIAAIASAPLGAVFLSTDTNQLLVSNGDGTYTTYEGATLPVFCASGFSGEYDIVNGTYIMERSIEGNVLYYNNKPYYKNDNDVTLFFTGTRWALDLTENSDISTDLIEKPADLDNPEGNYFLSDIGSHFGAIEAGVCT